MLRKVFMVVGTLFLIGALCATFIGAAALWYVFDYVDPEMNIDFDTLTMNYTSIVYIEDSDTGELIEVERLDADQARIWADLNEIPKNLQNAFIAIEDERFLKHQGVDWKRTIGAVFAFAVPTGKYYGGSTITQQLIKNLTGEDEVKVERKVKEILRALELEKKYSKEQILEVYLNTIGLGGNRHGVQMAANVYFGKDVSELSLAECASIAGITKYPTKYNPFLNPDDNKERQEVVLNKMCELGMISEKERDDAKAEVLVFQKEEAIAKQESKQSYFIDQVIVDVINDLKTRLGMSDKVATHYLYNGGLQIVCTMDPDMQKTVDRVFSNEESYPNIKGDIKPEASMVIIDPVTGYVKAIVGGRGQKTADRVLNRATQTKRSPGSAIKPLSVYAPAIEYDIITYGTVMDDTPFNMDTLYPKNQNRTYSGLSTVKRAVELSLNTLPIKIMDLLTPQKSFDFLQNNLHFSTLVSSRQVGNQIKTDMDYAPLALGGFTDGVTVLEMAAGYVPFSNEGMYMKPVTYTLVKDANGDVLLENAIEATPAMSEETAYIVNKLLEGVVQNGTGTRARIPNMPVAGKTGTTDNDFDRWFVGYTPYYVGAVWFGYDTNKTIPYLSVNPALHLWKLVMEEIHAELEAKSFDPAPSGIVTSQYCKDSGMLPGEYCSMDPRGSRIESGYFKKGTEPKEACTVHVPVSICAESNTLANEFCPHETLKTVALLNIRREAAPGLAVTDAQYVVYIPTDEELAQSPESTGPYPGYSKLADGVAPMNSVCEIHSFETSIPDPGDEEYYPYPGYDPNDPSTWFPPDEMGEGNNGGNRGNNNRDDDDDSTPSDSIPPGWIRQHMR